MRLLGEGGKELAKSRRVVRDLKIAKSGTAWEQHRPRAGGSGSVFPGPGLCCDHVQAFTRLG